MREDCTALYLLKQRTEGVAFEITRALSASPCQNNAIDIHNERFGKAFFFRLIFLFYFIYTNIIRSRVQIGLCVLGKIYCV